MITQEPTIRIGIVDHQREVTGEFNGRFAINSRSFTGKFRALADGGSIILSDLHGNVLSRGNDIVCIAGSDSTFVLDNVAIGINFHWERAESQTFQSDMKLMLRDDGTISAINVLSLEQYLVSVISSEMSAAAPLEFLKAHAITSRSWVVAMLEREQKNIGIPSQRSVHHEGELVRWYDREDHDLFDVCADDHCQRYQGFSKIISPAAIDAVDATRGMFIVYNGKICDARFSKSCGGLTERFENCWEDKPIPYLQSITDSNHTYRPILNEELAEAWIRSQPDAYCNTHDAGILRQILPSFDQGTTDFFRWKVEYVREELEELLRSKSGMDFGTLMNLTPIQRGPSGRIVRLRIEGTKKTLTVGKELEIRRWLSKSHLYSSAFIVAVKRDTAGVPTSFVLNGAGWGHGVGLCQIGAAMMAAKGKSAEEIVKHYFSGVEVKKLY